MLSNTDVQKTITIQPFFVILTERSGGRIAARPLHSAQPRWTSADKRSAAFAQVLKQYDIETA